MLERLRDKKLFHKPQQRITTEQWEEIKDRASKATSFMKYDNLVCDLLRQALMEAESIVLENRVKEVREEVTVSEQLKKVFITPQKIQFDELVGQIKFIRDFFAELKSWIDFHDQMLKKEADGIIVIETHAKK